jgi:phosphoglycerate dehydrogenase-like enzyme
LSEAQVAQVEAAALEMRVVVTRDREEIEDLLDDVEIAVGGFPRELLSQARNIRWFQQWGAGADWLIDYPEVAQSDLVLTNVSGVHAIPISEHILSLMLAFARYLHQFVLAQGRSEWLRPSQYEDIFELAGKTMVLIGVGAIGKRTAKLAAEFDMRVLGVRRHPEQLVPNVDAMYGPDQLLDVLPEGDFVVLTVPLTPQTEALIGEEQLAAMKQSAYIVNIGRGGTIDQKALIRALQEGSIAGAGLDVFETEPLPEDSPLWDMENVIITPHFAGGTPHYDERAFEIFLDNLHRYQAGEPLHNVVDKQLAY